MFMLISLLSASRIPLAFLFLSDHLVWRVSAIILALITDGLDGYLARRYNKMSQFGALLDPLADKFFVLLALIILVGEGRLCISEACMMLARDAAVVLFGGYLWLAGQLANYRVQAILTGKVTTVLQAIVLLLLVWQVTIPFAYYCTFPLLGLLAFIELCLSKNKCLSS